MFAPLCKECMLGAADSHKALKAASLANVKRQHQTPVGMPAPPTGKLTTALAPLISLAALSYARAASSALSKVPSHSLQPLCGSRISAAYLPQGRCLTPRYLVAPLPLPALTESRLDDLPPPVALVDRLWWAEEATVCWLPLVRRRPDALQGSATSNTNNA